MTKLIQGYKIIAIEWSCITLTLGLVILLLRHRLSQRTSRLLNISDFFVILAWISFLIQGSFDTALFHYGAIHPNTVAPENVMLTNKIEFVEGVLYLNTMYCAKAAILAQYAIFIPDFMTKTRYALRILSVIVFCAWLSQFLANLLYCLPLDVIWNDDCDANAWQNLWYTQTIPHIATDILVYLFAIPTILKLELSRRQIIELLVLFGTGFVCIVCAFMNILPVIVHMHILGIGWIFSILEQTWAIIVVCLPVFRHLITKRRLAGNSKLHGIVEDPAYDCGRSSDSIQKVDVV